MRKTIILIILISLLGSLILMTSWTIVAEVVKNMLGLSVLIIITTVSIVEFIPAHSRKK